MSTLEHSDEPSNVPAGNPKSSQRIRTGKQVLRASVREALRLDQHLVLEVPDHERWSNVWLEPLVTDAIQGEGQVVIVGATEERLNRLLNVELPEIQKTNDCLFVVERSLGSDSFVCPARLGHLHSFRERLKAEASSGGSPRNPGSASAPGGEHRKTRPRNPESSLAAALAEVPWISFPTAGELDQLESLAAWLDAGGSGRLTELPVSVSDRARRWAVMGEADCLHESCPFADRCPAQRAVQDTTGATVVVTDYPTLFAGLQRRRVQELDGSQARNRVLVLLEAHAIRDLAVDHFATQVSLESVRPLLLHLVEAGAHRSAIQLWKTASEFFREIANYFLSGRYAVRLREGSPVSGQKLMKALEDAGELLHRISGERPERIGFLRRAAASALEVSGRLEAALSLSEPEQAVSLDLDGQGQGVIYSEPLRVDRNLASLFDARVVLVLSDTLAVGGRVDAVRLELGIPETARELVIPHPRSERPRLLLVVPESLPDPNERSWPASVASRFLEVLRQTEGAAVGCFASEAVMANFRDLARSLMLRLPTGRTSGDLTEFRLEPSISSDADPNMSRSGNDPTRGACVFLDRLPFESPDMPLHHLERELEPRWFPRYALPRAVRSFRRAARHLLNSEARHAVMIVCDKRILTRSYASLFTEALPGVTISRSMQDVVPFLTGKETSR